MNDELIPADGVAVPPDALELRRARDLARLAGGGAIPYVRLVECRRDGDGPDEPSETVVIEVDVERPQAPACDIRLHERVAAVFRASDARPPEALALRTSFPLAPHQNHTRRELPRSLCLYDRPWAEVAIRWTPAAFVERVRDWLKFTAKGSLHQDDQPLEQLLFDGGLRLILPTDLLVESGSAEPTPLSVFRLGDSGRNLVAVRPSVKGGANKPPEYVATTFTAQPQTHGIIRQSPDNLWELHEFLTAGGIDLVGDLRRRLRDWEQPNLRTAKLIIVVAFPVRRADALAPEDWDFWAFLATKSVREIGIAIGLWGESDGQVALLLVPDHAKQGRDVPVGVLAPYLEFSRATAAAANAIAADARRVVAVGAGALGSQVITTLARSGFGTWTIVDEDDLLPHNLARHALGDDFVGMPKADGLTYSLNQMYAEGEPAEAVVADVMAPGEQRARLDAKYASADLILDIAASVPVARHLAVDVASPARRVSVFLNPLGSDLVVLAEDKARTIPLDALELQYYRAAASRPDLAGHLASNPGRLRYGRSCRDITAAIPTHLVGLHAAVASRAVRRALESEDASIRVWRCDPETQSVTAVEVAPSGALRRELSGWTLVLDEGLREQLAGLRLSKLPNETGGVLIGAYDLTRRIVYAVDTVPSPPDSAEWPTLYIRGSEGLLNRVRALGAASGGQLEYVGEWHSHPDGCPTLPSADDLEVFAWLTDHMTDAGLPALMAIVGERDGSSWFLGTISSDAGWRLM